MLRKLKQLSKSSLLKESLIYGLTNALYSGLPILLLPLLLNVLSPKDLGFVEFYRNFSMILIPILGLCTAQSVIRFYYDLEAEEYKTFVSNIVLLHFVMAIIGILVILSISIFISNDYFWLIGFSIVFFLFNQITEILLSIFRAEKSPKKYLIFRMLQVVIDIGFLSWFFFLEKSFDWTYRVYPNLLAAIFIGALALFFLKKKGYFTKVDLRLLKMAILFGAPLILHMLSAYMLNIGDRFFILYYLTEEDLGNYSVMYQLGMLVNFLFTSFNLAWVPTFFELLKSGKTERIKKIKSIIYIGIIIFSALTLTLVHIVKYFTSLFEQYEIDMGIIFIVTLSYILFSMYKFESNYFFYFKRTKKLSIITLGAAIITITLNILLIPSLKLYGCAIATLVACLFMFTFVSYGSKTLIKKSTT